MSRRLNDLSTRFRPLAVELLARAIEARLPVLIVDTRRTAEEQAQYLKAGTSKVKYSKHQDGDALDIVPYQVYTLSAGGDKLSWDTASPDAVRAWKILGEIGESLGLRWGGRFLPLNKAGLGWDPGHFEYPDPPAGSVQRRA